MIEYMDLIVIVIFSSVITIIGTSIYYYSRVRVMFTILGGVQSLLKYLAETYDEDVFVREAVDALEPTIKKFLYVRKNECLKK